MESLDAAIENFQQLNIDTCSSGNTAVAQRATTKAVDSSTTCKFLELPGELRNRIYRETLVIGNSTWINISPTTFAQPGLLRTCHQIRAEASSIYYMENNFDVHVDMFNHALLAAFCKQAGKFKSDGEGHRMRVVAIMLRNLPNPSDPAVWTDLLKWVESYWKYEVPRWRCRHDGSEAPQRFAPCCAASVVFELVDELPEMSWQHVEDVLKVYKRASEKQARGEWQWQ